MENLTVFEVMSLQQANREFYLNLILAIVSLVSALLVYLDYRNRKNKERAEKSINIAEQFAQSVIPKLSLIYRIFQKN